jgi:hypothetical protein
MAPTPSAQKYAANRELAFNERKESKIAAVARIAGVTALSMVVFI